jgi:hypothetical protein
MMFKTCSIIATIIIVVTSIQAQPPRNQPAPDADDYRRRSDSVCVSLQIKLEQAFRDSSRSSVLLDDLRSLAEKCLHPRPVATLTADVAVNSATGGFADFGKNIELPAGTYTFRLVDSTVRYGEQQSISEIALLRMNIETKDAYLTLNGIGDTKVVRVPTDCTLSVFFVPGEPTYDDSGSVTVEVFRHGH